jgi:hypothetical protein
MTAADRPLAQLCVYRFDSGTQLDGGLIAALERMEVAVDVVLLDALFVTRDPASGAVMAIDMQHAVADGTFASALDFRLDPLRRAAITAHLLADRRGDTVPALSATIDGDAAVLVVLHQGAATALADAVTTAGGRLAGSASVPAATIEQASAAVREIVDR